jgi:2-polyprenyl-3-methyl-5-hydroxy-6-metoxy-1,4-benzoquinol methylase
MSTVSDRTRDLDVHARQSLGSSGAAIYRTVATLLRERSAGGTLADVGCGGGNLWREAGPAFSRWIGVDAVRYEGLPEAVEFFAADLDRLPLPLEDGAADVVAAVEVIEHLENPRAFWRELVRLARPGGWVVVTTPNQLSLLSLVSLVIKQRFSAFQDSSYPAHITALLEADLRRIAAECTLEQIEVRYTAEGRIPGTGRHYPAAVSAAFPRWFSDNVVLIGRTRD